MHSPTAFLSLRLKEKTLHHLRTHIHFNQVHTLPLNPPGINIVVSEKKDGGKNKTVLVAVDGIHFTILKPGGSGGGCSSAARRRAAREGSWGSFRTKKQGLLQQYVRPSKRLRQNPGAPSLLQQGQIPTTKKV